MILINISSIGFGKCHRPCNHWIRISSKASRKFTFHCTSGICCRCKSMCPRIFRLLDLIQRNCNRKRICGSSCNIDYLSHWTIIHITFAPSLIAPSYYFIRYIIVRVTWKLDDCYFRIIRLTECEYEFSSSFNSLISCRNI